ncbi:uncharacterized protein [Physcomitrium patens]|uniref:DNL-type domain-containing protein n=1 Tax=Physcomitrium patens TaxID=3218 RepID=A0A2K1KIA9_PHYPA|nr:uncharacterized protein LOC112282931 [Physcomitrium patens]PNR53526.1 hypothetical protein PHYPA_007201 [Physcomitrium patens]|eukprot:XP_024376896.1 uncharacterized protein LOC112282931 [Physcomitrella patens]
MATGAVLLQVGTRYWGVDSCALHSNRVCGFGTTHEHCSWSKLKVNGSREMKLRDRLGFLRSEKMKLLSPIVGAASQRFDDAFEEPAYSDSETEAGASEVSPDSLDKEEISPEAGAIVVSSLSTSLQTLSKDEAMGIILNAAGSTAGWTTGSGLEGPSYPMEEAANEMPGPIFSKSPRRRMRVAFTCNVCGHRSIRAINPHAYTDGTVFVQCEGCDVFHKLVDNLKLFHELKGRIYKGYECFEVGYDQYYDFLG